MQITVSFDPLNGKECQRLQDLLDGLRTQAAPAPAAASAGEALKFPPIIAPEDAPDVGREVPPAEAVFANMPATLPAGAIPLPLDAAAAPSTAAAPQLPSAPVAPMAGVPMPPAAPLAPAPTLAAAAPAVPANATPAASPAGGVELDSAGLPWDERIHASTKTKIANGQWKSKRGLNDPAFVKRVEDELRGVASAPTPPAPPAAPVPPAPPGPVSEAAAVFAPPAAPAVTFEQFMGRLTYAMSAGLGMADVQAACVAHGLASVVDLQKEPAKIPQVIDALRAKWPTL